MTSMVGKTFSIRRAGWMFTAAALLLGGTVAVPAAAVAASESAPAAPRPGDGTLKYVALGDSFTSGPFLRNATGPLICGRSGNNYPSLVVQKYPVREFVDVSCAGATMEAMFEPQLTPTGLVPPQLDAVTPDTNIVTLGLGADSMGFGELALTCAPLAIWPWGDQCKRLHNIKGDEMKRRLELTKAKLVGVIEGINNRAPNAEIFIVGYPAVLPDDGVGCWPFLPLATGDLIWLRDTLRQLNQAIYEIAASRDVHDQLGKQITLVDTYTGSIGHDLCKPHGTKWYEHVLPTETAAPLHPNHLGMQHAADRVVAAFA